MPVGRASLPPAGARSTALPARARTVMADTASRRIQSAYPRREQRGAAGYEAAASGSLSRNSSATSTRICTIASLAGER